MRLQLSLTLFSTLTLAHTSQKFLGLANPEARKDFCKLYITTPCERQKSTSRFRRNAVYNAGERCQWAPERRNKRQVATTEETFTAETKEPGFTTAQPTSVGELVEISHNPTTEQPFSETTESGASKTSKNPGILIILDETGSMQDLGGMDPVTGWGRGRDIIIDKFNQFVKLLQDQVSDGIVPDSPLTFVTFNVKAKVLEYDSILEIKPITEDDYNPGFGTNLYDSLGCTLSEYFYINNQPAVRVFIISDGIHQPDKGTNVVYVDHELHQMVSKFRDEQDWEFSFYGAMNPEDKAHLKHEAMNLGIRWSETKKFDFSERSFDKILKSISNKLNPGYKDLISCSELENTKKTCKKGKRGKFCRKRNKSINLKIEAGECKLDIPSDEDQIMT